MPVFLDTNVLIYSISVSPAEAVKRERALVLLDRDDGVVSVQVLQEFYVQATRPSGPKPLPHALAVAMVEAWQRHMVVDNTVATLRAAFEIKERYGFSYWDSAVVAAARAAGCTELYTEDLSHGQVVEGVRVINPFKSA
ncbi:PIN domain-containing protein [Caulobacter sp. LARHSG274]